MLVYYKCINVNYFGNDVFAINLLNELGTEALSKNKFSNFEEMT